MKKKPSHKEPIFQMDGNNLLIDSDSESDEELKRTEEAEIKRILSECNFCFSSKS
jgi:hypothetical protein